MPLFFIVFSLYAGTDPYFPDGLNSSNSHLPDDRVITKKMMNQNLNIYIRAARGNKVRGNIVLIPTQDSTTKESFLFNYLRLYLCNHGWHTLAIDPPHPPEESYFHSGETEKASTQSAGHRKSDKYSPAQRKKINEELKQTYIALIKESITNLPSPEEAVIYVGENQSAGWLIDLINSKAIPEPKLLVIIDPYFTEERTENDLASALSKIHLPIMEVDYPHGSADSQQQQHDRTMKLSLNKKNYRIYEVALNKNQQDAAEELLDEINGMSRTVVEGRNINNPGARKIDMEALRKKLDEASKIKEQEPPSSDARAVKQKKTLSTDKEKEAEAKKKTLPN